MIKKLNKKTLKETIITLSNSYDKELYDKKQVELDTSYWFFKYDFEASDVQNLYHFYDKLSLYERFCSHWEEHHNGSCCVVERENKYLIPKIKEFLIDLQTDKKTI